MCTTDDYSLAEPRITHKRYQNRRSRSTTAAPGGSGHPFGLGQILNPYPVHYKPAFAFSTILCPLHQQLPLQVACRLPLRRLGDESVYHVPRN